MIRRGCLLVARRPPGCGVRIRARARHHGRQRRVRIRQRQALVVLLPDPGTGRRTRPACRTPTAPWTWTRRGESTRVDLDDRPHRAGGPERATRCASVFGDAARGRCRPAPRHFTLFFKFESEELTDESRAHAAGRAAGGEGAAGSGRRGRRPHRHHRAAAGQRAAGPAARHRRAHAAGQRRAERGRPSKSRRTARPSCSSRPPTASSSRATGASRSPFDEVDAAAPGLRVRPGPDAARRRPLADRPAALTHVEYDVYDTLVRAVDPPPPSQRVVVVDVDEKSLAAIGQWPWRRDVIGTLIARLREMGAAAVGVDVIFPESDRDADGAHSPDSVLAETLRPGARCWAMRCGSTTRGGASGSCVRHPLGLAVVTPPGHDGASAVPAPPAPCAACRRSTRRRAARAS